MAKNAPKIANISIFGHFRTPYGHHRGMITTYSYRGGSELWLKSCYIKISQELASEMRKMWSNLNFDMITFKFDNLIHAVLKMLHSHAPSTMYPTTHIPYHPCAASSICPILLLILLYLIPCQESVFIVIMRNEYEYKHSQIRVWSSSILLQSSVF